jgi:hypothetical protein
MLLQNLKGYNMNWIRRIWNKITLEIRYRRKLKELRKRDPFIYK